MSRERLDKVLAQRGAGSRSKVAQWVRQGRVRVAGEVVRDPAAAVDARVVVQLDDEAYEATPEVVAWHKPLGVHCTLDDPWGRADLSGAVATWLRRGLHPVGRLDADTSGLLLLSADGALTQRLLHPKRGVEKLYRAQVEGTPDAALVEALERGVATAEGTFAARSARIVDAEAAVVELVVTEGKHRMVRRMLANAGHPVVALTRLRFASVELGALPVGEARALDDAEVAGLRALAGQ